MRWSNDTIARQTRSPAGWGRQVRSYVEGVGVKDLRTGVRVADMDAVLDGDIDPFLRAALAQGRVDPFSVAIPD